VRNVISGEASSPTRMQTGVSRPRRKSKSPPSRGKRPALKQTVKRKKS
jgi:hypothetical protein